MAKRRKRAEDFPDRRIAAVEQDFPKWLEAESGFVEIDASLPTDEAPEEVRKVAIGDYGPSAKKNADALWKEIIERRLDTPMQASKVYEYAGHHGSWAAVLKEIQVYKDREPVGWYDLDGGLVQYATLWDLVFEKQPLIVDDRKLFLMTEEMWEAGEYPPEVAGKTTSKEAVKEETKEETKEEARVEEATPAPQVVESIRVVEAKVLSQHQSFKAADKAARKNPNAFIIHEAETSRTNERWLVAVPPGG